MAGAGISAAKMKYWNVDYKKPPGNSPEAFSLPAELWPFRAVISEPVFDNHTVATI